MKRNPSWECAVVTKSESPVSDAEMSQRLALVAEVLLENKSQLRHRFKSPILSNYQILRGQFRLPISRRKTGTDD
jgi:hypothetical protein